MENEKKIEQFWRDADGADVMRVMDRQTVEIRVRDADREEWRYGEHLGGFHRGNCDKFEWKDRDGVPWRQCQVYDPPAWWLNKPDPGEGFRLLEKFPHEDKLPTDEYWNMACSQWLPTGSSSAPPQTFRFQADDVWYRRRIETNPPTSSDGSRSRDTIPSGWRLLGKDEDRLASDAYWSSGCKDWIIIGDDRVGVANELPKWHAIRRLGSFDLVVGFNYILPNGQAIRITEKGFELATD